MKETFLALVASLVDIGRESLPPGPIFRIAKLLSKSAMSTLGGLIALLIGVGYLLFTIGDWALGLFSAFLDLILHLVLIVTCPVWALVLWGLAKYTVKRRAREAASKAIQS